MFGDSLLLVLTSETDKELIRSSEALYAVEVYVQSVHWAQQRQDWVSLVTRERIQINHLVPEWSSGNFVHVAGPVSQDNMRLCQAKL